MAQTKLKKEKKICYIPIIQGLQRDFQKYFLGGFEGCRTLKDFMLP